MNSSLLVGAWYGYGGCRIIVCGLRYCLKNLSMMFLWVMSLLFEVVKSGVDCLNSCSFISP